MTTDVAKRPVLLSVEDAERALAQAVEEGNAEGIRDASLRADAQAAYDRSRGLREQARELMRLVVLCEAAIGELDLRLWPFGGRGRGTVKGDPPVRLTPGERVRARTLALCARRGLLAERIEECGLDVTPSGVLKLAIRRGDGYVAAAVVAEAITTAVSAGRSKSRHAVLTEAGVGTGLIQSQRMSWMRAAAIADVLGTDPTLWPPAAPCAVLRRRRAKERWIHRERARTGSRWDECYSRLRLLIDEFASLAPTNDNRYDAGYEHLYALEQSIGERMRREA